MPHRLQLWGAWTLVALYAGGIFVLSSLSQPPSVSPWDLPHLDKLQHAFVFGGLTFVFLRALRLTYPTHPSTSLICWAVVLTSAYGALDELHQAFTPARTMSVHDLLADAAGALVVAGIWLWIQHRRRLRQKF
jgi:VanZ family protein